MNAELHNLVVYCKGKKLIYGKDYIIEHQQVKMKKKVNKRFVQMRWEIIQ